jgi:hypothetical protein
MWALIMSGLAYWFFGGQGRIFPIVFMLYLALGIAELAVGLFKWLWPSAEGFLLDAFVLLLFAGWNIGWQVIRLAMNMQPTWIILLLGVYMLSASINRFKLYVQIRKQFSDRPTSEQIAWFDELVREIRAGDPSSDDQCIDIPTRPKWKVKLLGSTAFFVAVKGESVWVLGADEFAIVRDPEDHGKGHRPALLRIYDRHFPEFDIDDTSWENYQKWLTSNYFK